MKHFLLALLMLSCFFARGQNVEYFRSLELTYGKTGLPGDIFKLKHERYALPNFNIGVTAFAELSKKNITTYKAYGLDVIAYYYTGVGYNTNDQFEVRVGLGGTVDYETENQLYKGYSFKEKLNYGAVGEIVGECKITEDLAATAAFTQKYLFNNKLGNLRYDATLGIKWKIW